MSALGWLVDNRFNGADLTALITTCAIAAHTLRRLTTP